MTTQTMTISDYKTAKHTRLVSFENSNSWLKRHDDEGTLVIQAGYKLNPERSEIKARDEANPIVVVSGQAPRWYGSKASLSANYTTMNGQNKIDTARESFTACLRSSDHERDLVVIASHWDDEHLDSLKAALVGQYKATVNGNEIRCNVISVVCVEEGMGSYHASKSQLKPGSTLVIEMGFGTAEFWLVNEEGQIFGGTPNDKLGISQLCKDLARDPHVSALGSDNSNSIGVSMLSRYLMSGHPSRISEDVWTKLKGQYSAEHFKRLQSVLRDQWADKLQDVPNIILTGGGAALLVSMQPKLRQVFVIPENPQIASVKGSYDYQLAKV